MLCSIRHASDHGVNAKVTFAITKDSFDLNVIFYLSLTRQEELPWILSRKLVVDLSCAEMFSLELADERC